ncbi:MAG: DUF3791 domain-containing protein [Defluviitaleaceae bacterium]|nr:DUF3791 domain-containing protein [Defluviitaleaceae bacterium]
MKLDKEFEFFIYLLEHYSKYKHTTADKMLHIWNTSLVHSEERLTDFILAMYWLYHTQALDNAFKDIDHLIKTGEPLY